MSQRGEIDNIVLAAVQKMAPVTRADLRIALSALTHEQIDGGLSRTMGRGLVVSVAKADIAPRGLAGRRYMLSSAKAAPPAPTYAARYFTAPFREATEACPDGWPPRYLWDDVRIPLGQAAA